jgi:DNA-binding HxlR family transcriptional regulator
MRARARSEVHDFVKYGIWTWKRSIGPHIRQMLKYGQFCPVAKTAEIFADRWSPLIIRELCSGTKTFGDFLNGLPLISRTMLVQRLRELARAGVVQMDEKAKGRGHVYTLTPAGEGFRPIIQLMGEWGYKWGQGLVGPDDLDSKLLLSGLSGQIDQADLPPNDLVVRFDFRGIPKGNRSPRRWWLLVRSDGLEVCLKHPGKEADVVIDADLGAFTKVWLGYVDLKAMIDGGSITLHGTRQALAQVRRMLKLSDAPQFRYLATSAEKLKAKAA